MNTQAVSRSKVGNLPAAPAPRLNRALPARPESKGDAPDHFSLASVSRARTALIAEVANLAPKQAGKAAFRVAAPMRIGVLALSGQGGSGNMARVCARALSSAGHQSFLLTGAGGFWDAIGASDVPLIPVDAPAGPKEPEASWVEPLAQQIAEAVKTQGLDAVMVHYVAGLLDATLRARELVRAEGGDFSVSATIHGTDVTTWGKNPEHARAMKAQLSQCESVTAVSQWMAYESAKLLELDSVPQVIPNSIDEDEFQVARWKVPEHELGAGEDIRRRLAPGGEVVFCHVSNFRPVKRPEDSLEAFARVRQAGVAAKLLLIGDGPLLPSLNARAEELGVADDIVAVGSVQPSELSRYLSASDICLVSSESESFCLAALEALACGTPVVGTDCGGLAEVISDVDPGPEGQSRLLVDVGDVEAMSERCLELLGDGPRFEEAQRQAVKVPFERFPRVRQEQAYLALADELRACRSQVNH